MRSRLFPSKNTFFSLLLGFTFLTPVSSFGNMFMLFAIALTFMYYRPRTNNTKLLIVMFVSFALSFCANSISSEMIGMKSVFRTVSLFMIFALFPFFNRRFVMKPIIPILLIGVVFISQLSEILNIQPIVAFMYKFYPWDSALYGQGGVDFSLGMAGRYGGIYRNPNDCGRAICILTALYLVCSHYYKYFKSTKLNGLLDAIIFAIAITAVVTTGSRTNVIIIASILLVSMFIRYGNRNLINKFILIALAVILLMTTYMFLSDSGSRIFSVSFSANDRKNLLIDLLIALFGQPIHLLFGYFYIEYIEMNNLGFVGGFDSDFGNILYYYGFAGLIAIGMYVWHILKKSGKIAYYLLPIFLTIVSNGLFSSYKASFHIMILLAVCWCTAINHSQTSSNH